MKAFKQTLIAVVFIGTIFSGVMFAHASAESVKLTDEHLQQIKTNCVSVKANLSRLHSNDALARVNVGQIYESISTKLMSGFNGRVANNNMNNISLSSVSSQYDNQLNTFRSDYITYENQLSRALGVNCSNNPQEFYDAVVSARIKRAKVYEDVTRLNQFIDQYTKEVDKFEAEYKLATQEVTQ